MTYQDPRYRDPEYGAKWRAANPEKQREYSRRYLADPEHREANRRRASAHYYANREDRKAKVRRYYQANRTEILERYGARKYGLTLEQYRAAIAPGRCAICHTTSDLGIDHDHASGAVRGLLCSRCNFLIGHGRDDPALLRSAAAYLEATDA